MLPSITHSPLGHWACVGSSGVSLPSLLQVVHTPSSFGLPQSGQFSEFCFPTSLPSDIFTSQSEQTSELVSSAVCNPAPPVQLPQCIHSFLIKCTLSLCQVYTYFVSSYKCSVHNVEASLLHFLQSLEQTSFCSTSYPQIWQVPTHKCQFSSVCIGLQLFILLPSITHSPLGHWACVASGSTSATIIAAPHLSQTLSLFVSAWDSVYILITAKQSLQISVIPWSTLSGVYFTSLRSSDLFAWLHKSKFLSPASPSNTSIFNLSRRVSPQ